MWMSYLFYAAWNPPFVILLWISTVGDWCFAKRIHASRSQGGRVWFLLASLALNLGMLAYFKYASFAVDSFVSIASACGLRWEPV
ncbi:MAG TPA: MBOAT family protein, partial [Thermoguttaceae bacterium]|nr:MBOAT family protein [Thermoguttaceae bacterium]